MRKKVLHIFALVMFLITTFTGCSRLKSVSPPDKIVLYKAGTQIEIDKSNPLFNQIIDETVKRFNSKIGLQQIYIDDDWESDVKSDKLSLEFIYSTEQITNLDTKRETQLRYTRVIFPLVLEKSYLQGDENLMIYGDNDRYKSCPIGSLTYSAELVNLLLEVK